MAKQYGFLIDASRCTGCRTCEVACKDKNNLPVGRNFRHVLCFEGGGWRQDRATGAWRTDTFAYYVSVSCNHCEDPACVKVCPTGALVLLTEDEFKARQAAENEKKARLMMEKQFAR